MQLAARVSAIAVIAMCGCRHPQAPRSEDKPPQGATFEQARNLERGAGVARDYAAAAAIYDQLCASGEGDRAACDALLEEIATGRGVTVDVGRLRAIATAMCRRGDPLMCEVIGTPGKSRDELAKACDDGDARACEAEVTELAWSDNDGELRRPRAVACSAGMFSACEALISELSLCDEPEVEDSAGCEQELLAEWRKNDYDSDLLDAAATLRKACDEGDAAACDPLPNRAIAPEKLCKAHDYGACAALACMGDDDAAAIAKAHHADANCYVAAKRKAVAWMQLRRTHPDELPLPPIAADPWDSLGTRVSAPFDSVRFHAHGGRDAQGWPRIDAYNVGKRDVVELGICAYAYDENQQQLTRIHVAPTLSGAVASGASALIELATAGAPPIPPNTIGVEVAYDHVRFADSQTGDDDRTQCPETRPYDRDAIRPDWL